MLINRKTFGVPAPHTRSGNKSSMEPSNCHISGQVSQHKNNQILKKENIPQGEKAVYTRLVVDMGPNKAVHERLRMRMGGDRMESVMETTTRIADLTTCKLHMNGVVSTPGARFAGGDVKGFYLNTPLKKKRYGKVRAKYIPEETIKKHKLEQYIEDDGWLHFEIGNGMYGIPEAGRLANDLLRARLKNMATSKQHTHQVIGNTYGSPSVVR